VLQLQLHQVKLYCAVKLVRSWGSPARAIPMSRAPQKSCEPGTPDEPITGFAGDLPTVGSLWFACTWARSSGSSLWGVAVDITTSGHTTTTTASITATAVGTTPLRCGHRLLIVNGGTNAAWKRSARLLAPAVVHGTEGFQEGVRDSAQLCRCLFDSACSCTTSVRFSLTRSNVAHCSGHWLSSGHKISKVAIK